jgi:hypothetical protein
VLVSLLACSAGGPEGTTREAGPERATVVGSLGGERLASGTPCVWLLTNGGERVNVAWPDGWSFDAPPATLIDASDNTVAHEGDVLTVEGAWSQAGGSLCGPGRQLQADRVTPGP